MMMKRNVHPYNHQEALYGIGLMKKGSNLLKHLNEGYPHI